MISRLLLPLLLLVAAVSGTGAVPAGAVGYNYDDTPHLLQSGYGNHAQFGSAVLDDGGRAAGPTRPHGEASTASLVFMGGLLAPNTTGAVAGPSVRYNRATHYGGAQTNSPPARALREGAEGTPCPSCGRAQVSGTNTAPVPEHSPSLLEHYYGGGHAMTDAQRRAYAQSADAFDGTMCLTCQRSQGGSLSQLSRWYAQLWDL